MTPSLAEATPTKPTRAQVLRDKVRIDMAEAEDGEAIAAVLRANGIDIQADWSKVSPHWLIAVIDGKVAGCCQVLFSKPFGFVEFLFVKPDLPFKMRAIAIRKLLIGSFASLRRWGCEYVGSVVDVKNKKFANVVENIGFVPIGTATLSGKRLK